MALRALPAPPPRPRGGGSGPFESFPGPAAGAEALRSGGGRAADGGRRDKGVGPADRRSRSPGFGSED